MENPQSNEDRSQNASHDAETKSKFRTKLEEKILSDKFDGTQLLQAMELYSKFDTDVKESTVTKPQRTFKYNEYRNGSIAGAGVVNHRLGNVKKSDTVKTFRQILEDENTSKSSQPAQTAGKKA